MVALLQRYLAGDVIDVWDDLRAMGSSARCSADAKAVAVETMRRVRRNLERLVARLPKAGYDLGSSSGPKRPPLGEPTSSAVVDDFERRHGALPLSLWAFYVIVGSVDLAGTPPALPSLPSDAATSTLLALDPAFQERLAAWWPSPYASLQVLPLADAYDSRGALAVWEDAETRQGVSGVGAAEIPIPNPLADVIVEWEGEPIEDPDGRPLFFLDHLRGALRRGGFPAFEPERPTHRSWIHQLTVDFEPL